MLKVALDFDGTVIQLKPVYTNDLDYELMPNAKEVITKLTKLGVQFELFTARTGIRRLLAIMYIKKYQLPIKWGWFNKKIAADVYIDDRNIFCKGIDWKKIEKELLKKLKEKDAN